MSAVDVVRGHNTCLKGWPPVTAHACSLRSDALSVDSLSRQQGVEPLPLWRTGSF